MARECAKHSTFAHLVKIRTVSQASYIITCQLCEGVQNFSRTPEVDVVLENRLD